MQLFTYCKRGVIYIYRSPVLILKQLYYVAMKFLERFITLLKAAMQLDLITGMSVHLSNYVN